MKVILFKSVSAGDILHALTIGIWQFGSNGKSGPVGYKTPPGSVVLIKCMENNFWYSLGLTKDNPETIPQGTEHIDWPSFEDMGKGTDYVAQVKFCSRIGDLKRYTEDQLSNMLGDLSKYKIAGVLDDVKDDIAIELLK